MRWLHSMSCWVSEASVTFFANPFSVLVLVFLSIGSGVWCVGARTELALTLFLSILALAITSAILYVGERRELVAGRRDEAMHAKLDALIRATPGADDALAGCEIDDEAAGPRN